MKSILAKLHRDGFSLSDNYQYQGTNPHEIRRVLMSSAEADEFVFAMDVIGFALVSNLYGTKIARSGFTDKKKGKFQREAIALVSCAKENWEALERGKPATLQISKNSIPASMPEIAIIVGGLDPSCVMPSMLQLALKQETKNTMRAEIDEAIGEHNTNEEAALTATKAQDKSRIGHKGSALLGKEQLRKLAESLDDVFHEGFPTRYLFRNCFFLRRGRGAIIPLNL